MNVALIGIGVWVGLSIGGTALWIAACEWHDRRNRRRIAGDIMAIAEAVAENRVFYSEEALEAALRDMDDRDDLALMDDPERFWSELHGAEQ